MDDPDVDPSALRESLAYIRKINRVMGYTRIILSELERFSSKWKKGELIRIVDVGTGSADIPLAILRLADERGWNVRVIGVDLHPEVARQASAEAQDPRLTIVRADALHLPMADEGCEYAITSMFLHHLDDADARKALTELGRVARRGIIASDLLRLHRAYAFIWIATLFSSPMVRHDARVSVAQAFNTREVLALRKAANLHYAQYSTHGWHRFILAGEKT